MSLSKLTEKYILDHPSILDCIKKDLINYSALAREICDFYHLENFDAVLIACRRLYLKINKDNVHEIQVMDLIKKSKMHVRNRLFVAIMEKPREMESVYLLQKKIKKEKGDFNLIEGEDVLTIITNEKYLPLIEEQFKNRLIKINKDLVQINLIFDERIETTSGVVSYLYSILSLNGINIVEEMSCWTDLMIILDEKDMAKAMNVLSF
ncbi:MAG: ACT domain-containing protein [Candidatus Woesearchaeota archaeon]|nr:ACT domain-containing protein [Candidatus Woesearchaeota archaeon]